MTTCILPTRTVLAGYRFSPIDLNKDAVVERFLSVTNNYDFLLKLMTALRTGLDTSFTYTKDIETCQYLMAYLTDYGYTVTPPFNPEVAILEQVPSRVGSTNNYYIVVSWA
jgi:hypothetical protein